MSKRGGCIYSPSCLDFVPKDNKNKKRFSGREKKTRAIPKNEALATITFVSGAALYSSPVDITEVPVSERTLAASFQRETKEKVVQGVRFSGAKPNATLLVYYQVLIAFKPSDPSI